MSEELFTGWGPDAPIDDTFVRAFAFSLADQFTTPGINMGMPDLRTEHVWAVDHRVPAGYANSAVLLQPLRATTTAAVMDEIGGFFAGGTGTALLWSVLPTPDLGAHGWIGFGHPPLMLRPVGGDAPAVPDELRIVRVAEEDALADFERTAVEAYPMPDAAHLLPGGLFGRPVLRDERMALFVGYVEDVPVATAGTLLAHGISNVSYVSTVEAHRGKGYGEALTWAATLADPALPGALLASDLGRPIYERMGYRAILRATLWGCPRA